MPHLNYNHLHYFWVVTTVGSIAKAAQRLHVAPQTVSGQLRALETRLGAALFQKVGRKLELTATGQVVRSYVEPMFSLGLELGAALRTGAARRSTPATVGAGLAAGVPKRITQRILAPLLGPSGGARVHCREAPLDGLLAALADGTIDFAVTDAPASCGQAVRVRNHLVGQCGVTFLCAAPLVEHYRPRFPSSLAGAPFLMPPKASALGETLSDWFRLQRIAPSIVAELESPELMSIMCEGSGSVFAVPAAIADDVAQTYGLRAVGEAPTVEQQFYVICAARQLQHECIALVIDNARERLRAPPTYGTPDIALGMATSSAAGHPLVARSVPPGLGVARA